MAHVLSVRLTESEHRVLSNAAAEIGADVSAVVRTLISARTRNADLAREIATLAGEVRALKVRIEDQRAAPGGTGDLPQTGGDIAVLRAALAAVIEHSLLPAAPIDRKPQLLAALKSLKGA